MSTRPGQRRSFLASAFRAGASAGVAGVARVAGMAGLGGFGGLAAMPGAARAAAAAEPPLRTGADAAAAPPMAAAGTGGNGWTAAYEGIAEDLQPLTARFEGRLPKGLAGSLYRNGPARHALGGERYAHWFDGDGAVQRYQIGPGGTVTHSARFVRTGKYLADTAAGRPVRASYGTRVARAEPLRSPDSINVANIHVLPHAGRLLALWEGGSAFEIDPQTLATRGMVRWADELAGMPFSAHPRVEPDGTLWNFGASHLQGLITLYRVGADGVLRQHHSLRVPELPMVHDFAVTERYIVFMLPPFVFDVQRLHAGATLHESHVWKPALGLRVMVLDKAQLEAPPRWFTLPPGFVFHIGNACEDGGVIRLDCMRSASAWQVQQGLMDVMSGVHRPQDHTHAMLVELDLASGRARQEVLAPVAEFPRADPRHVGRAYRQVFAASREGLAARPGYDAVMRMDLGRGSVERHRYGDEVLVEEHVFVPRERGGEGEGWLIGTALDLARREMLFSVFDAQHLAAGPLAQARVPRLMPFGLHASFVPA